ncbi:hypothetical protein J6590_073916, partial [Homalodisca vitripennis]
IWIPDIIVCSMLCVAYFARCLHSVLSIWVPGRRVQLYLSPSIWVGESPRRNPIVTIAIYLGREVAQT